MKSVVLIGSIALALTLSLTSALECHHCLYIEGDDNFKKCFEQFGDLKIDCSKQLYGSTTDPLPGPHYCAKFDGKTEDGKVVIVRNCWSNKTPQNVSIVPDKEFKLLEKECQAGYDTIFNDGNGVVKKFYAGTLCPCKDDDCNAVGITRVHLALPLLPFLFKAFF